MLQCVAMCYRLQFVHVLVLFFAHMIRIIRLRTMFRRTSEHGHSLEKKRKRVKDGKRHSLRLTIMGLLRLVRSLNYRSVLQKSPIKGTKFCKRDI